MGEILTSSNFHIGASKGSKGWTGSKIGIVYKIPLHVLRKIQKDNPGIMQNPAKFDRLLKSFELQGEKIYGWDK